MDVPFWVWAITVAAILGMLVFDFVGHVRTPHAPSMREAATWSAVSGYGKPATKRSKTWRGATSFGAAVVRRSRMSATR